MKKSVFIFLLAVVLFGAGSVAQAEERPTVLTSLDITQVLCEVLCADTYINVENVVPGVYSMAGHKAYFKKHQKKFFAKAARADAVVAVTSVWAADPLYLWARRGNIRIVDIDAGKPLDGYGAGVPLTEINGTYVPYVWRSPANLTRMASIVTDDLGRMYPDQAEKINGNLKKLQAALFKLRAEYEDKFLDLESNEFGALTAGYVYLADEFGLNVHFHFLKQEDYWTEGDAQNLGALIKQDEVKTVICPWEPGELAAKVIADSGARAVVLNKFVYSKGAAPLEQLLKWYKSNLSALVGKS
ncbi:metal ABC transporter solute-binding protein, Zn/Mn family [Desulfovibrio sp. JC010]|uniref:metal ABC transporter substrate-binding protein n=1 Tax=Desulfovibrio sp. JC010 TaxID=2593641 RepID=UPI0013D2E868|nr:zinc ABC transporter substrate-binding protein [Desulfovibrio sp. JC010]NDV28548.1 zinc ABC transporter substrate-binding protein [Desulfovibrio sp. JC010]